MLIPQYSTVEFRDVFENYDQFQLASRESGFPELLKPINLKTLYHLLFARYGNSPIANRDIHQWKTKVFAIVFQYGPAWEKKLEIQQAIRELTDEELITGSRAIYNQANNPDSAPGTAALNELPYINSQSTSIHKRARIDAYALQLELIKNDVSEDFIKRFEHLFKVFVKEEHPLLYVDDQEE